MFASNINGENTQLTQTHAHTHTTNSHTHTHTHTHIYIPLFLSNPHTNTPQAMHARTATPPPLTHLPPATISRESPHLSSDALLLMNARARGRESLFYFFFSLFEVLTQVL